MDSYVAIYYRALILCLIAVGVMAVFGIYRFFALRKRREGLFELAQQLNLNYDGGRDTGIPGQFGFLKQFDKGEERYATNVLSGNYQQNEILAFDYHYATYQTDRNGTHKEDHWFSCCILTLPAAFPELRIRRENVFTKVGEVFGYQDIKFESAEFSKTFNVQSADKKFAYDICNAKMMEYLLANRDLNIEIENNVLALLANTRLSVEKIQLDLQRLTDIRSRLPEYLFANIA